MHVPLSDQVKCIQRELGMRRHVYPGRIARGHMTRKKADQEIRAMEAVLRTLQELEKRERLL